MKIGLSYSRCVRDIIEGKVDIDDVLLLITRTDFDPRDADQWNSIWVGYGGGNGGRMSIHSNPEWSNYSAEDEDRFRSVSIELWESGKLHQPRKFGAHPQRLPYIWVETILPSEELDANPALKMAWDKFQTLAQLTSTELLERHG
jgi:hypothetical protein